MQPYPDAAYLDGSAMLSVAFGEIDGSATARRIAQFTHLYSSVLLEAEMRSAFARVGQDYNPDLLMSVEWVYPTRPLSNEIEAVLQARYLRSGDLLHVATALYAASDLNLELAFITLDANQQQADALGFTA